MRGVLVGPLFLGFDQAWPIFIEALKIAPTGRKPPSLWAAIEARPIEAMHPQDAQSGLPPNWQGVIFVCRSAESVCVVSANTQSAGCAAARRIAE